MKFLFIVQGEGRGHLTQAISLAHLLRKQGHEICEVLVGKSSSRQLPAFFTEKIKAPICRFESPNFLPTPKNKRNNLAKSIAYNLVKLPAFIRSIRFIQKRIRQSQANAVINFYELLTGLTYALHSISTPQYCIGHQYLFLHPEFRFPEKKRLSRLCLLGFTKLTCIGAYQKLALSFHPMADDPARHIRVVPPLLREEVLQLHPTQGNYILGYLVNAGFASDVMVWHQKHPDIPLRFFWDKETEIKKVDETLSFHPLDDEAFLEQMKNCKAYASTAGFESICEAMYLNKKVLMVPAHIEQDCNAADAERQGIGCIAPTFNMDYLLKLCGQEEVHQPQLRPWFQRAPQIILHTLTDEPDIEYPFPIAYNR